MTRQTPAELAAEQRAEVILWLLSLHRRTDRAHDEHDHEMTAKLHRSLRTTMQTMQQFDARRAQKGGDAIT